MDPDKRQQFEDDMLQRAGAFEVMVMSKGWEHVKAYYQAKIQALANGLLTSALPITEFEGERREIMGLQKLLALVDHDLYQLAEFRKKHEPGPTELTSDMKRGIA